MSTACALAELVELQRGTTYKSALLGLPGPVLLGLASIAREGGFRDDSLRTYGGESPDKLLLRPGDLYVSLKDVTQSGDLLGSVARVPLRVSAGRITQDTVKLVLRPEAKDRAPFLYWVLRTPEYRAYCRARAIGTTNLSLSREDFLAFEVPPPTPDRLGLVRLLDAIEAKIELNQRANEALEETARLLFKHWFVDFRLDQHGGGAIPEGWRLRPLGEWVDALSGGTPSKSNSALWGGDLPWISPKAMTEIHADEADTFVTPIAVGNGARLAPKGSTLVMVRGMGLHQCVRVSLARREVTFNQDVKALVPRRIEPGLLLFAMLDAQADLLGRVESSGHGTGVLPTTILLSHPIAMPSRDVQKEMVKPFDLINDRIAVAREESRTLAELRDLLLPTLLSGALRIRDVERAVEAVA